MLAKCYGRYFLHLSKREIKWGNMNTSIARDVMRVLNAKSTIYGIAFVNG